MNADVTKHDLGRGPRFLLVWLVYLTVILRAFAAKDAPSKLLAQVEVPGEKEIKTAVTQTNQLLKTPPNPEQMERGRLLYMRNCFICHQLGGQGVPGAYPPL